MDRLGLPDQVSQNSLSRSFSLSLSIICINSSVVRVRANMCIGGAPSSMIGMLLEKNSFLNISLSLSLPVYISLSVVTLYLNLYIYIHIYIYIYIPTHTHSLTFFLSLLLSRQRRGYLYKAQNVNDISVRHLSTL